MNTSFERGQSSTNEWYTPKEIWGKLGHFDLDPCAPVHPFQHIAENEYNAETNGLAHDWEGRVWLNPPYSHPLVDGFIKKMCNHNNGIALLLSRCDQAMWHDLIFPTASALLFIRGRIKFLMPDGSTGQSAGCGSVLIAWGGVNSQILRTCGIDGFFIELKKTEENEVVFDDYKLRILEFNKRQTTINFDE